MSKIAIIIIVVSAHLEALTARALPEYDCASDRLEKTQVVITALPVINRALKAREISKNSIALFESRLEIMKSASITSYEQVTTMKEQILAEKSNIIERLKTACEEVRVRIEELKLRIPNRKEILENAIRIDRSRPGLN